MKTTQHGKGNFVEMPSAFDKYWAEIDSALNLGDLSTLRILIDKADLLPTWRGILHHSIDVRRSQLIMEPKFVSTPDGYLLCDINDKPISYSFKIMATVKEVRLNLIGYETEILDKDDKHYIRMTKHVRVKLNAA